MSISILLSMDEVNSENFTGWMIAEHIPTPTLTHPLLLQTPRFLKPYSFRHRPRMMKVASQNCMRDVGLNEKRWGEERNDGGKVESHHNFFCVFWVTATECHIIGPKGAHYHHHHHLHIQHQKGETIWFLSKRWDTSLEVMENVQTAKQAFITKVF